MSEGTDAVGSILFNAATDGNTIVCDGYDSAYLGMQIATAGVAAEYKPVWLTID